MEPRYSQPRKKGFIDRYQQRRFNEKHAIIQAVLQKELRGLSRDELKQKTHTPHKTLLKHLQRFKKDGQIKEIDRRIYWITQYEKLMEIQSLVETVSSALEHFQSFENFETKAFFSENIFLITPIKDGDEQSWRLFMYPLEQFKANPQKMLTAYSKYSETVHANRNKAIVMGEVLPSTS
jgi:hypothetical protein